MLGVLFWKG
uniref:Uncharacterized protein n=1 Tax=Anguilla anguilla TaxID=7936 RepID=A0A0E9VSC6_ANGAN